MCASIKGISQTDVLCKFGIVTWLSVSALKPLTQVLSCASRVGWWPPRACMAHHPLMPYHVISARYRTVPFFPMICGCFLNPSAYFIWPLLVMEKETLNQITPGFVFRHLRTSWAIAPYELSPAHCGVW
jgi:hypothetical protein